MLAVAAVSAFMSNTAATAFFVPLVIGYASRVGVSPSRFLLPLAFSSILTSSVNLISTSTNLVVSDLLTRYQQPPMGMFELAPVGIPIAVVGILYVWVVGVRLIPQRENQKAEAAIGQRKYQADVVIGETSPLIGKSLKDAKIDGDAGLTVVKLIRNALMAPLLTFDQNLAFARGAHRSADRARLRTRDAGGDQPRGVGAPGP